MSESQSLPARGWSPEYLAARQSEMKERLRLLRNRGAEAVLNARDDEDSYREYLKFKKEERDAAAQVKAIAAMIPPKGRRAQRPTPRKHGRYWSIVIHDETKALKRIKLIPIESGASWSEILSLRNQALIQAGIPIAAGPDPSGDFKTSNSREQRIASVMAEAGCKVLRHGWPDFIGIIGEWIFAVEVNLPPIRCDKIKQIFTIFWPRAGLRPTL
jgi:hypothetical protein